VLYYPLPLFGVPRELAEGRRRVQHLCAGSPHLSPLLRCCCYQLRRSLGTTPAIAVCASLSPPPVPCSHVRHHPWCVAFVVSFVVRDYLLLVLAVVLPVLGCAVGAQRVLLVLRSLCWCHVNGSRSQSIPLWHRLSADATWESDVTHTPVLELLYGRGALIGVQWKDSAVSQFVACHGCRLSYCCWRILGVSRHVAVPFGGGCRTRICIRLLDLLSFTLDATVGL
jgi:hypothetical protein